MVKRKRIKKSRKQMIRLFVFEFIFMLTIGISAYFISLYQKMGYEKLDDDIFVANHEEGVVLKTLNKENQQDPADFADTLVEAGVSAYDQKISQYRNILLVGVDARDQSSMTRGANADVLMLVNINEQTGEIRLVSILRDTLLRLIDGGSYYPDRLYDKANAQNCYTDISDTVSMLNLNLDLNITEYAVVNWSSAAKIVDTLGGVEMNIENEEILGYLNGYLTEVNEETGIFAPQLKETGMQLLSGTQAVSFCRIRYAGLQDFGRTNNQREVVVKILEKMKTLLFEKPSAVMTAVNQAAESVVTNLTLKDIGELAFQAGNFTVTDHCAFPFHYIAGTDVGRVGEITGGVKDVLVVKNLEEDVKQLHQFLYGEAADDYEVPSYVKQISEDILWMAEEK